MKSSPIVAAYYYPGWHHCSVRDQGLKKGWSEWDLVYNCRPKFPGHQQPNLPLWGRYDESDPVEFSRKLKFARKFLLDAFIFAFYWSRGKRLLDAALNNGFLGIGEDENFPFALMWANRMPRKVLPVKDRNARLIDPARLVYTDHQDFMNLIKFLAPRYFSRKNYLRVNGKLYLSVFDTTFFIRQLGLEDARTAISAAREWLKAEGFGDLHLGAIDPIPLFQENIKEVGFDSVTHYVFLPDWKGPLLQDFGKMAEVRKGQWPGFSSKTALPYFPSVSPGWDANPRGCEFGKEKPRRYPWSPIVVNRSPEAFSSFLQTACEFSRRCNPDCPLVFISSWNEWSEGHYLEPDEKYEFAWLKAVREAKNRS